MDSRTQDLGGDGAVGTVQSGAAETDSGDEACEKEPHGIKSHSASPCAVPYWAAHWAEALCGGVSRATSEATVQVSDRTVSQVSLKTVDGKTEMTDAEVYAANVNSVVSINVTGTSGYNFSASQYRPLRPAPDLSSQQMVISSPTIMWWKMQRP